MVDSLKSSSAAAQVAEVAAQSSSHVVVVDNVRGPAASASGSTQSAYRSVLEPASRKHSAKAHAVASHAQPAALLAQLASTASDDAGLVSLLGYADRQLLTQILPQLSTLISRPVAVHLAASDDHSNVMALRSSGAVLLHSADVEQAYQHALLASRIALQAKRLVIHFYEPVEGQAPSSSLSQSEQSSFLRQPIAHSTPELNGNGNGNGHHVNGNGKANGYSSVSQASEADSDDTAAFPSSTSSDSLEQVILSSFNLLSGQLSLDVEPYVRYGSSSATNAAIIVGAGAQQLSQASGELAVVEARLVRPIIPDAFFEALPSSVRRIVVLEKSEQRKTRFGPFFVDVASAFHQVGDAAKVPPVLIGGQLGHIEIGREADVARLLVANLEAPQPTQGIIAGSSSIGPSTSSRALKSDLAAPVVSAPKHEEAYTLLLEQSFEQRLQIVNSIISANSTTHPSQLSPEYAFGQILAQKDSSSSSSKWIIGSDAWAYDAGMSGVHHVIASGRNVNMLIFDSVPYSQRNDVPAEQRKKDIGLYAMNYGGVYVASTAIYADFTQVLHAITEADKFNGPSIVLAHIPYRTEDAPALEVLRETKLAVDSGYWPLYRWDPSAEARKSEVFRLDSVRVREQLKEFLDRQNHLSFLTKAKPELSYELAASQGTGLRDAQKRKAKEAYEKMLGSMDGPPLLVLYASDGGNAEKVAKKLGVRAKARGLAARVLPMDDYPVADELKDETNVAFISSTAGQGEAPQNGRETVKTFSKLDAGVFGDSFKYTVFGMGDSHYWPRPEDAHFYNKPAKDIDARLEVLGAERFAPLGLGDDQDADGWQTGYKVWEPQLWKALGVDNVEVKEAEPEAITNEHIKIASNYLRGTIKEGLEDKSTGAIAETDTQLTKFHGTYMQYDRDTFEERKAAGLEPAYSFMIRCRIPGGVCTPEQWIQLDDVAEKYGNKTVKITTRQTIQYHCVVKGNLKAAMQGINKSMLDTIAACGDVNRNVMCSPNPALSELHEDTFEFSKKISEYLLPRMNAYHEIWLDKGTDSSNQLLVGGALKDYEPLYGPYYLPRKFKIAIAVPPRNDTDCFAHDIGLIAIADRSKRLAGFNLVVGGGMGVSHGNKATYPRLGNVLGFVTTEQTLEACKQVMLIQRDTGNRQNRKNARLKYTVDKVWGGPDNFRAELERRLGYGIGKARPYHFENNTDEYGWTRDHRGKWHCTLWLENGRVRDAPGDQFRTGLRELCKIHKGKLRMTPNQHIIVADIEPEDKPAIEAHLKKWKMDNWNHSGVKLSASACVAFPTCGLAMAESERYLPVLVEKVEKLFIENGLREDEVTIRMTGCPNGCARPWVAEIAFVGKAPGSYQMMLGGGHAGQRLNKVYKENVGEAEILKTLKPLIRRYAQDREQGEPFGDWVIRAGVINETTNGGANGSFWEDLQVDDE
ncbi:Sulfite reductase [NADPH] subunit beta [Tilletia horrida]|uniref:assimilatory sulfite reductase (NADPH) n=1 Tax=Tilletia horrida TaxID=155126 RepID=A0AAN6GKJ6_9BASI|nr:Sulfite reductase [NADPH] subunit beta [Tilletia horrida]KAK0545050.1 Sulfite reductase [NADPH] subunit beta [Tilletia horrida]KAK0562013.1 Sulfite reductase [NADPH] subunit beta [Tilletia horrida]